jgi:secondary thiamine-phosphate synthase enzyme
MLVTFPLHRLQPIEVYRHTLHLRSQECLQFIDLTEKIRTLVRCSNICNGLVNVQTKHTTTAILINENEPLLLQDLRRTLESFAPREASYLHDDFDVRTVNMTPDERPNGHAHCKAMFLRSSETLNAIDGKLDLGCWQSIFFLELDAARERSVSITILGTAYPPKLIRNGDEINPFSTGTNTYSQPVS